MYTVEATVTIDGKSETREFSSTSDRGARWKAVRWINKSGSYVWEWRFVNHPNAVWSFEVKGEVFVLA
ncbi:MAG: hypothetical protein ACYSQZ_09715 [Planctomycetota bacterium]|jgi:hypothetical protein